MWNNRSPTGRETAVSQLRVAADSDSAAERMPGLRDRGMSAPQARWARFRMGAKLNIATEAAAMEAYQQRQSKKVEELTKKGKVVTEVDDERDADSAAFHEQGNAEMYNAENLKKRRGLQRHPKLLETIERWWDTCIVSTLANGIEWNGQLPKSEFVALNCRLYKARCAAAGTLPRHTPPPSVAPALAATLAAARRR